MGIKTAVRSAGGGREQRTISDNTVFAFGLRDRQSVFSDSEPHTIEFAPVYISRRRDVGASVRLH